MDDPDRPLAPQELEALDRLGGKALRQFLDAYFGPAEENFAAAIELLPPAAQDEVLGAVRELQGWRN